jgi:DNA primase
LYETKKIDKYNKLADKFHEILINPSSGKIGIDYLHERNIEDKSIKDFKLGYCPENIKLSGLLEHMAGRIIFPIFNEYNDVIAFSGRFPKDKKELKQGEGVWFHESFSKQLYPYGLNIAWEHILFRNEVIIVEGQCDVISMHQAGYKNTIGLLGGSFTEESFGKLARFTNCFISMFDGDLAGREAAKRLNYILNDYKGSGYENYNISLVFKENGKNKEFDPDEFIRKYGKEYIKKVIDKNLEVRNEEIKDLI